MTKSKYYSTLFNTVCIIFAIAFFSPAVVWSQATAGFIRTTTILSSLDTYVSNESTNDNGLFLYGSSGAKGATIYNSMAYLRFDLGNLPREAKINSVMLRMYVKSTVPRAGEQFVRVFSLKQPANWPPESWNKQPVSSSDVSKLTAISSIRVQPQDVGKAIDFKIKVSDNDSLAYGKKELTFLLAAGSQQYYYYSSRSGDYGMAPRLVIEYSMPYQLQYSNWSQYRNDAQHTGMLAWRSNTTANGYKMDKVISWSDGNSVATDPVLCNNALVYAHQSPAEPRYTMRAYTEGGQLIDQYAENSICQQTIADRANNIYYLKGATGDYIRQLAFTNNKFTEGPLKKLADNSVGNATPVVGFDGSIYISTNQGIFAYTPMPEFKVKWVYPLAENTKYGSVALSTDEKFVFTYGNNGMLIALNNVTGKMMWRKDGLSQWKEILPVPAERNGSVCITDGHRYGKAFYMLNDTSGVQMVADAGSESSRSAPVIGTDNVTIIADNKLVSYKLSDGAKTSERAIHSLEAPHAMINDEDGNIYVLSTKSSDQYMELIKANGHTSKTPALAFGELTNNYIIAAPDGKLFVHNLTGIYSFSPTGFDQENGFDIDKPRSDYLYRSVGKITLNGNITPTQNVIIHSGKGGVLINPGFNMKTGSQLAIKAGY